MYVYTSVRQHNKARTEQKTDRKKK